MSLGLIKGLFDFFRLPFPPESVIDTLHTLVRKGAHFTAYMILALLVQGGLVVDGSGRRENRKKQLFKMSLITLATCSLYAATDEIHQAFVPNRGPAVLDVAIDSLGACAGLGLWWFWRHFGVKGDYWSGGLGKNV